MDKIYVVFWTQGGNTQAMAEAIGEGIREGSGGSICDRRQP